MITKGQWQGFLSEMFFINHNRGMILDPGLFLSSKVSARHAAPSCIFSLYFAICFTFYFDPGGVERSADP